MPDATVAIKTVDGWKLTVKPACRARLRLSFRSLTTAAQAVAMEWGPLMATSGSMGALLGTVHLTLLLRNFFISTKLIYAGNLISDRATSANAVLLGRAECMAMMHALFPDVHESWGAQAL